MVSIIENRIFNCCCSKTKYKNCALEIWLFEQYLPLLRANANVKWLIG